MKADGKRVGRTERLRWMLEWNRHERGWMKNRDRCGLAGQQIEEQRKMILKHQEDVVHTIKKSRGKEFFVAELSRGQRNYISRVTLHLSSSFQRDTSECLEWISIWILTGKGQRFPVNVVCHEHFRELSLEHHSMSNTS